MITAIAYTIPCISGKDSMKNDYVIGDLRIAIPPTLLFSIIGAIDDVRRAVTMDVKQRGRSGVCAWRRQEMNSAHRSILPCRGYRQQRAQG